MWGVPHLWEFPHEGYEGFPSKPSKLWEILGGKLEMGNLQLLCDVKVSAYVGTRSVVLHKIIEIPSATYSLSPSMPLRLHVTSIKPSNKQTCL